MPDPITWDYLGRIEVPDQLVGDDGRSGGGQACHERNTTNKHAEDSHGNIFSSIRHFLFVASRGQFKLTMVTSLTSPSARVHSWGEFLRP